MRRLILLVSTFALILVASATAKDKNWSQWRGSDGTGVSSETNLPAEWSSTKNIKWKTPLPGGGHSSPILFGDYLYIMTDRGMISCLDATTGKLVYEGARLPIPATFTASPVAFDGKILLTSEDGDTFVIKAGPQHEVIATNSIDEPVYASPAISDGMIFLRGEKNLYCIGKM